MDTIFISKTTFLDFQHCPKNTWLKLHRPELLEAYPLSDFEKHLVEQGNMVELYARGLFPDGITITSTGEEACRETAWRMGAGAPALFQPTFVADAFIAKNDVLARDEESGRWDLYEAKGSNAVKEEGSGARDHITDLAFQAIVLKRARVPIGKYFVIRLNKEYARDGALDIERLFIVEDVTEQVRARMERIEPRMEAARAYLNKKTEPEGACGCVYRTRKNQCTTFEYNNPDVPAYSAHDISRIHKHKLARLVDRQIYDPRDIPDDFELSDKQWNQVRAYQTGQPEINRQKIAAELGSLHFPLYFFDYETFGPAIPLFDGYRPYQRIPFQFSLHILREPGGALEHIEYLHEAQSDPTEHVAALLAKYIKPSGTIIAWHTSFEMGVNREIGERIPALSSFFADMNTLFYDIKTIFSDQQYIHPDFKGSASLKDVLPAIVSEVGYGNLAISDGGQAADAWWKMVSEASPKEAAQIARDLKTYCGVDTYAMYAIWRHLREVAACGG